MGISRRQYSKIRGISESAVRHHIARGVLAPAVLADGTIDAHKADELLKTHLTRAKVVPVALTTAKTRRLRAIVRKLGDEVYALNHSLVRPDDAAARMKRSNALIARCMKKLPVALAPLVAGQDGTEAHRLLRDGVIGVLEDISTKPSPKERPTTQELDINALTPVALEALRANLQAERLELDRAVALGQLLNVHEVGDAYTEKMGISKSLLLAIPGRVASQVANATVEEARTILMAEVAQALAPLEEAA